MKENLTLELCKKYLKDERLWDLPWDEIEDRFKIELYRDVLWMKGATEPDPDDTEKMIERQIGLEHWIAGYLYTEEREKLEYWIAGDWQPEEKEEQTLLTARRYNKPSEEDLPLLDELYRLPCIQDCTALHIISTMEKCYKKNESAGDLLWHMTHDMDYTTWLNDEKIDPLWAELRNDESRSLANLGAKWFSVIAPDLIASLRNVSEISLLKSADIANRLYEERAQ